MRNKVTYRFPASEDGSVDRYTGKAHAGTTQVDHVLELQLLGFCCDQVGLTRGNREVVKAANDLPNLNRTSRSINLLKAGVTRRALNRLRHTRLRPLSLEDAARCSAAGRSLVEEGTWEKIEREMARSHEAMEAEVAPKFWEATGDVLSRFLS